jgi:hypothetical protein
MLSTDMIQLTDSQIWGIAILILGPIYVWVTFAVGMKISLSLKSAYSELSSHL